MCYSISLAVLLLFMRRMLDTRALIPKTDVFIRSVAGALLLTPIGFALAPQHLGEPTVLLCVVAIVTTPVRGPVLRAGQAPAQRHFFATAFPCSVLAQRHWLLRGLGWLPSMR
ncbi:MAG: hypothetical protein IPN06_10010 [Burkholderiales bacterium]|nr:hypothetical protein [Burkholderiales bacterium]